MDGMVRPHGKIMSFISIKGGEGKDTLVGHLAWHYVAQNKKVLLIDLDPQNMSEKACQYGLDDNLDELDELPCAAKVLLSSDAQAIEKNVVTINAHLDILQASYSLLMFKSMGNNNLRTALRDAAGRYHVVLINTPAGWDALVTNAIVASDLIITPVRHAFPKSHASLDWLRRLIRNEIGGEALAKWHIVINQLQVGQAYAESEIKLRVKYGNVLSTRIPKTEQLRQEELKGDHLTDAKRWDKAYPAIKSLASELWSEAEMSQFIIGGDQHLYESLEQKRQMEVERIG